MKQYLKPMMEAVEFSEEEVFTLTSSGEPEEENELPIVPFGN